MTACRGCGADFEAKPHQIANSDFECPPCSRERRRKWRALRKANNRPVVTGKMTPEYHRAYHVHYAADPVVRARSAARMRGYRQADGTREHHLARSKARQAIASGRLVRQPCEVCGATEVHAHHDDYSKPLDVRWLCPPHHREHHAKAAGDAK